MATLETQYKDYMANNPDSTFTFEEWREWWGQTLREAWERYEYERAEQEKRNQENNS